jgi:predicted small lipoprotein YifL
MKRNLRAAFVVFLSLLTLAACGGGGGAAPPPASATCTWDSSIWDNCNWGS